MEIFRTEKKQVTQYEPLEIAIQLTEKDLEDKDLQSKIEKAQFEIYKLSQSELYKEGIINKETFLNNLKRYKKRSEEVKKYLKLKI